MHAAGARHSDALDRAKCTLCSPDVVDTALLDQHECAADVCSLESQVQTQADSTGSPSLPPLSTQSLETAVGVMVGADGKLDRSSIDGPLRSDPLDTSNHSGSTASREGSRPYSLDQNEQWRRSSSVEMQVDGASSPVSETAPGESTRNGGIPTV